MTLEKDFSLVYVQHRSWLWKSLETGLLTLVSLLILFKYRPGDPFFLTGPVPWLFLLPVFCSLFYSAIYGIASLFIILFLLIYQHPEYLLTNNVVQQDTLGAISFTFISSFFSSYWISRIQHVERLNRYVREHLEDMSKEYYMLRLSHERIEQAYIVKPVSIRDVFYKIGHEIRQNECAVNEKSCDILLGLFSQYCSINNAVFCFYNESQKKINPISYLGKSFSLNLEDPLIQLTLNTRNTNYLAVNMYKADAQTKYIAVIPLLNNKKEIIALIVIKDMAFWSLTHDNLEVLSVFAAYFSMQWQDNGRIKSLVQAFPNCPSEFLREFQTLVQLKQQHKADHSLACMIVPESEQQRNIVYTLKRNKRTLDFQWIYHYDSFIAVINLMPLTGLEGLAGYKNRMDNLLINDFGLGLNTDGIKYRSRLVNDAEVSQQLNHFLKEVHHAVES